MNAIWQYLDQPSDMTIVTGAVGRPECPFCRVILQRILDRDDDGEASDMEWAQETIAVCPTCGWWWAEELRRQRDWWYFSDYHLGATGRLRMFAETSCDEPLDEVRQYLTRTHDARFAIEPRVFEDVVAAVFRDIGYRARATAFSGDGGVDVVLDAPDGEQIGVQVKRYKGKIKAELIRELVGALVVNGLTTGIFITTSDFQPGARSTADAAAVAGYPVALVNGEEFLAALEVSRLRYGTDLSELRNTYRGWQHGAVTFYNDSFRLP